MSAFPTFTRSPKSFAVGITLITLLSLGLRLFRLANQSFWVDEVNSLIVAQGPLQGIYERSLFNANSLPTYFLLLKPFVTGSGANLEFPARLLSVIAGTLSVPLFIGVIYAWRRQRGTALLAGILLAINPLHLWYSQETRGYAVMFFFGLLTLFCFERGREKPRPLWWMLYTLAAVMAVAVHRTAAIFPVACGLWHLWEIAQRRLSWKNILVHLPIAAAVLVMLALKTMPPKEGYGRAASGLEIAYTFLTFAGGYSFGPTLTDIQSHGPVWAISKNAVETGILLIVLLALAVVFALHLRSLIRGREIQLLLFGIGTVSVYALVSGFPYNVRYALPALVGFLALIAVCATEWNKSPVARLSIAAFLVLSLWADWQWFYSWQYRKGDSRAVVKFLEQNRERIHSWTVLPSYMDIPIHWYLQSDPEMLAREIPATGDRFTKFPPVPDVLIITRRHHLEEPDKIIAAYESSAPGVETNLTFAAFELYIGAKKNPAANDGK
jgi:hypothetical protein